MDDSDDSDASDASDEAGASGALWRRRLSLVGGWGGMRYRDATPGPLALAAAWCEMRDTLHPLPHSLRLVGRTLPHESESEQTWRLGCTGSRIRSGQ